MVGGTGESIGSLAHWEFCRCGGVGTGLAGTIFGKGSGADGRLATSFSVIDGGSAEVLRIVLW